MLGLLFWVLVLYLLYKFTLGSSNHNHSDNSENLLSERNKQWIEFIASYKKIFSKPSETRVIDRILSDVRAQGILNDSHINTAKLVGNSQAQSTKLNPSNLDNATLLLYLGGFLFLASSGLFVAFGGLSGLGKSIVLSILTLAFYFLGIYIFQKTKKLKPAGLTFMAIGMLLVPLVGLAVYKYVYNAENGGLVWLSTSLVGLALYISALRITKSAFVNYFVLGSILSIFESGVSIFDVAVYWYAWTAAIVGILFMLFRVLTNRSSQTDESLRLSSNVLLPATIALSLIFMPSHGLAQAAFTIYLAAGFYVVAALQEVVDYFKARYWLTASFLFALSLGLFAYQIWKTTNSVVAILSIYSSLHLLVMFLLVRILKVSRLITKDLLTLNIFISAVACFVSIGDSQMLSATLALLSVVSFSVYRLSINSTSLLISVLSIFSSAFVFGKLAIIPALASSTMALIFACITLSIIYVRYYFSNDVSKPIWVVGYWIGLVLTILFALNSSFGIAAAACLGAAFIILWLSYLEKESQLLVVSSALFYGFVGFLAANFKLDLSLWLPFLFLLVSIGLYFMLAPSLKASTTQTHYIHISAVIGAFVGASFSLFYQETTIPMIASLALAGALGYKESSKTHSILGKEAYGAVTMLSVQWFMFNSGVRGFVLYAHLWALLAIWYALWRNTEHDREGEHNYLLLALVLITIPVALRALGASGQAYGWFLILEQIAIILTGMWLNKPFIVKWGLTASILAVLYQLRELTFIALGLVGVAVIALAIYLLNRYEDGSEKKK